MSREQDYKNITFIIPTIRGNIRTTDSIPAGCDVRLEREATKMKLEIVESERAKRSI